jgi:hypothetical protein
MTRRPTHDFVVTPSLGLADTMRADRQATIAETLAALGLVTPRKWFTEAEAEAYLRFAPGVLAVLRRRDPNSVPKSYGTLRQRRYLVDDLDAFVKRGESRSAA